MCSFLRLRKWKFVQFEACESGDKNGIAGCLVNISTGGDWLDHRGSQLYWCKCYFPQVFKLYHSFNVYLIASSTYQLTHHGFNVFLIASTTYQLTHLRPLLSKLRRFACQAADNALALVSRFSTSDCMLAGSFLVGIGKMEYSLYRCEFYLMDSVLKTPIIYLNSKMYY